MGRKKNWQNQLKMSNPRVRRIRRIYVLLVNSRKLQYVYYITCRFLKNFMFCQFRKKEVSCTRMTEAISTFKTEHLIKMEPKKNRKWVTQARCTFLDLLCNPVSLFFMFHSYYLEC